MGRIFCAPVDLILEPTSVFQPDLLFIAKQHQNIITERAVEGVPDLVVEILSPATSRIDRLTKAQIYARHKVPAYSGPLFIMSEDVQTTAQVTRQSALRSDDSMDGAALEQERWDARRYLRAAQTVFNLI